jgi:chemotaxis protein methyltransferase CheR
MVKITQEEHDQFCQYIQELSGIHLDGSKAYLLETRLASLLEQERCNCFSELYHKAKQLAEKHSGKKLLTGFPPTKRFFSGTKGPLNCFSTKLYRTSSMREELHLQGFSRLRSASGAPPVPPGQEIYSIAMVLKELLPDLKGYRIQLLGTDLSNAPLPAPAGGSTTSLKSNGDCRKRN